MSSSEGVMALNFLVWRLCDGGFGRRVAPCEKKLRVIQTAILELAQSNALSWVLFTK